MSDINLVIEQSETIKDLIRKLQNLLLGNQLVQYFKADPTKTQAIIDQTVDYRSRRLVLLGLKNALQSSVLPADSELHHDPQWLAVGDCVLGWRSGLTGLPRIITEVTDNGYRWRYITEESDNPPNKFWPWLNGIGFEKIELISDTLEEQLTEIISIQDIEIDQLNELIEYFQTRQFMNG